MTTTHPKVAFLGTGLLGFPMAERLLENGVPLAVWNRTAAKAAPLGERGARVAESAADAVRDAEVVILMLTDFPAIREVLLAQPVTGRLSGRVVVQMGTIAPDESREAAARVEEAGGAYLEAPVLGSIPQARAAELMVMAGGEPGLLDRVRPVLACFGPVRHIGPVGAAAALKLALNQLIATLATAYATGLAMVRARGVPVEHFIEIVRSSALHSPSFDKKLPRWLGQDYSDPNFPVKHLLKDVRLCRDTAAGGGLATEVLDGLARILERTIGLGCGEGDYSALAVGIEGRRGEDVTC